MSLGRSRSTHSRTRSLFRLDSSRSLLASAVAGGVGSKLAHLLPVFQGSMDVQREIAFGTPRDVEREVRRRLDLFFPEGGLVLGPSHAVQPGSPVENIVALYRTAGSLMDPIPARVLEIEGPESAAISMSKLF